jgi:hypothetical protein
MLVRHLSHLSSVLWLTGSFLIIKDSIYPSRDRFLHSTGERRGEVFVTVLFRSVVVQLWNSASMCPVCLYVFIMEHVGCGMLIE